MARLKVKANELKDVRVGWVSLVKRGANRIPFRIIKSDENTEGTTAVLDMDRFFMRKADTEEAERVSTRKSEDLVKAAMDILTKAGYEVKLKSEPASDGTGISGNTVANPAEGKDAGGPRNDGTGLSGNDAGNPAAGAEAGGPRNDGTGVSGTTASAVVKEDAEKEDVEKAAKPTMDAKGMPMDPEDMKDHGVDEDTEDAKKACAPADKKMKKADDPVVVEDGTATDTSATNKDKEGAAVGVTDASAASSAEVKKTEELLASIKGMFTEHSALVKGELDKLTAKVTDIDSRVQKSEEASAAVGKRIAALVPDHASGEVTEFVRKTDSLPPPLDTGYSMFSN